MKRLLLSISILAMSISLAYCQEMFNHLDLSVTAGSTGIGFDVAMPVNDMFQVRAGADFMPHFHKKMNFGVEVGDVSTDAYNTYKTNNHTYTGTYQEWRSETSSSKFNKLSGMLEQFTGLQVNNSVDMIGEPMMNTFKMLVDVFPFKENKHWHFTAGFYVGGRTIAKSYNTTEDMTTLMAVTIYNDMYKRAVAEEPLINYQGTSVYLPSEFTEKVRNYGMMSLPMGEFSHDIIATEDVYWDYDEVDDLTGEYVHMRLRTDDEMANWSQARKDQYETLKYRFHKGEIMYHKGDIYYMMPDDDNMVKAKAKVNAFRPYIGFGYGGFIDKQKRTQISFDCGVQFWGGIPKMITHDGIDMINDLTNVRSSVQHYLNIVDKFPVYPVLSLRISQRLF